MTYYNMSFEEEIQDWVTIDNRLKLLNEEVKQLRGRRSELSNTILDYVDSNKLSRATINISDGKIKFVNTKVTSPLTYKFIHECLAKCLNPEKAEQLINFIKSQRISNYNPDIKRYYVNN